MSINENEILEQLLMSTIVIQFTSITVIVFILGIINSKIKNILKRLSQKENNHHTWVYSDKPLERTENEL